MPANPITTRLPEWLEEELNGTFTAAGEGRSEGMRRIAEEWWTLEHFPAIEFRDGVTGRRASVRGGPDVWEIAMVARGYAEDREGLYSHFGWIPREHVEQALAYAEKFASEVNGRVELNERIGRQMEAAYRARARPAG